MIVEVVGIGIEIAAIAFSFEEGVDAGGRMIAAEIEDVKRVIAVAVGLHFIDKGRQQVNGTEQRRVCKQ